MAIIVMNDGTELNFDNDWSSIILSEAPRCKKVCFDLTTLKKKDKVYSAYKIPQSERILAFCKDVVFIPLTIEGIVFTDQAFYRCPAIKLEDGSEYNRISYASLDSCIIVQEGVKGGVYACTQNHEFCVYNSTPIAQNVAGYEIREILRKVQRHLIQREGNAKRKISELVFMLLQRAKNEMGIEELSGRTHRILDCLMELPEHADAAAMVKAEYIFREFKPEKYKAFAESLPVLVSYDINAAIKRVPSSFIENYISMITDLGREFPQKALSEISNRISSLATKDQSMDLLHAYLSIRMVNSNYIYTPDSEFRKKFGDKTAEELAWFRCTYFYHEMYKVYEAIIHGTEYPDTYWRLRDGLGLTPLHYAIILNNQEAIAHLLKQKKWEHASPCKNSALSFQMYEYAAASVGKQLPNVRDILLNTHAEAAEICNEIKQIERKLKGRNAALAAQRVNLSAQRNAYGSFKKQHADEDKLDILSGNIETIKETIRSLEEEIADLSGNLSMCEEEAETAINNAFDDALHYLENVRTENPPLAGYLYRIYYDPNFFEKVLRAIRNNQELRLYNYEDFYFIAPAFAEIDLPHCDQQKADAAPK